MPAKSPPVSILFAEFSEETSRKRSTKSGETYIGNWPRAREPVVKFLTFLVADHRLDSNGWQAEELLVITWLIWEDIGTLEELGGEGGLLMVSWYNSGLFSSLGLSRLGFGLIEDKGEFLAATNNPCVDKLDAEMEGEDSDPVNVEFVAVEEALVNVPWENEIDIGVDIGTQEETRGKDVVELDDPNKETEGLPSILMFVNPEGVTLEMVSAKEEVGKELLSLVDPNWETEGVEVGTRESGCWNTSSEPTRLPAVLSSTPWSPSTRST